MKLMLCERCSDIVAPWPTALLPRRCRCEFHAVWWVVPQTGVLRLFSESKNKSESGIPFKPEAWVLGISNDLLRSQEAITTKEFVQNSIDSTPDYYQFRKAESLIIKLRPGMTGDTGWANYPGTI